MAALGGRGTRERIALRVVASGYAALALFDLLAGSPHSDLEGAAGFAGTVVLSITILYAVRAPLLALLVGGATVCFEVALHADVAISPAATLVNIFAVGRYTNRKQALIGLGAAAASVVTYYVLGRPFSPAELVSTLVAYTAFWALAYAWRQGEEAAGRAAKSDRELLLAQIRTQMARDLHDIVGHTLNVVVVHAGAARLTLDSDVGTSRDLLLQIERVGREAIADLDETISMLRDPSSPPEGPARPVSVGIAGLPDLVSRFDGSGVRTVLDLNPALLTAHEPPHAAGLEAYRIVQESLTNVLKYAAPCTVHVRLHAVDDVLVVSVRDDGGGPGLPWTPGGGLTGMQERAARVGGTVHIGPVTPDDATHPGPPGFRVEARLPFDRQTA